MALTVGAFITCTNPVENSELFYECLQSALGFCDDVVVVNGKFDWEEEFDWPVIGEHFQRGYEQLNTDWVVHLDCDFILHEKDYDNIRLAFSENNHLPALSFWKFQIFIPTRYHLKSRLVIAVNKGAYKNDIAFDSGSDLCQPSFFGKELKPDEVQEARIPFYNYEKLLKSKEQVARDAGRMDRAYYKHFGKYQLSKDGTDESAFEGWLEMVKGRFTKHTQTLDEQPGIMKNVIKNLKPEQFGYDGWGELK